MQNKDMDKLEALGGVVGLGLAISSHHHTGLDSAAKAGSPASVEEHSRVFGPNTYKEVPSKNFFALCWENLQDPIILLLIAAALVGCLLLRRGCCCFDTFLAGGTHALQLALARRTTTCTRTTHNNSNHLKSASACVGVHAYQQQPIVTAAVGLE